MMGHCGDVCDYCPRYTATKSGDMEKLKEAAALWYKAGLRPRILTPEEIKCGGCSPEACPSGIAGCSSGKGLNNCGECSDYPCPLLQSRFDKIPELSEKWKNLFSKEQYELGFKAFWQKKENLDRVHKRFLRKSTPPNTFL